MKSNFYFILTLLIFGFNFDAGVKPVKIRIGILMMHWKGKEKNYENSLYSYKTYVDFVESINDENVQLVPVLIPQFDAKDFDVLDYYLDGVSGIVLAGGS